MMKYYDPATRKRPVWEEFYEKDCDNPTLYCRCGSSVLSKVNLFEHWQQGYFDVYDEVKEIKRSPDCCGCPSFPLALCIPCARYNGYLKDIKGVR